MATLFAPRGTTATLSIQGHSNASAEILSLAIRADGTLAIAWRDGVASGIDIRDPANNFIRVIDTGSDVPTHLSFGDDNALWAFGCIAVLRSRVSMIRRITPP